MIKRIVVILCKKQMISRKNLLELISRSASWESKKRMEMKGMRVIVRVVLGIAVASIPMEVSRSRSGKVCIRHTCTVCISLYTSRPISSRITACLMMTWKTIAKTKTIAIWIRIKSAKTKTPSYITKLPHMPLVITTKTIKKKKMKHHFMKAIAMEQSSVPMKLKMNMQMKMKIQMKMQLQIEMKIKKLSKTKLLMRWKLHMTTVS